MKWYAVEEDLPPENQSVLAYAWNVNSYHIAQWTSRHGWLTPAGHRLSTITHWSSQIIDLPWDDDGYLSEEAAKKYNIRETEE